MANIVCPTCKQQSMIEIEELQGGFVVMACMYCDLPQEEDSFYIYKNHCWNCGFGIDSRFSQISSLPNMGYICGWCGKDLTEWKLRKGLISLAELNIMKGAYQCYSTVTNVRLSPGIQ